MADDATVVALRGVAAAVPSSEALERASGPVIVVKLGVVVSKAFAETLLTDPTDASVQLENGATALLRLARPAEHRGAFDFAALARASSEAAAPICASPREAVDSIGPGGRKAALDLLLEECRKPQDGLVSRHLNRHLSLAISRRIVELPISPNQVTAFTFAVGVAAAVVTARGGYGAMLLGATLLQLNSILDGVDGELARLRRQQSFLGEWLDTIGDDLANLLFYLGMAAGAQGVGPAWMAPLGYGAALCCAGTMVFYYSELIALGRGDFYALDWDVGMDAAEPSASQRIVSTLLLLLKKDAMIFALLIAAILGKLPFMLPLVFAGTVATLGAGVIRTVRRQLPRKRRMRR